MMKYKVKSLLFGAGAGSSIYKMNTAHKRDFIGLIDNDKNKIGKVIDGLQVYSPADIFKLDFDEIVITTQWALEVEQQLLVDLNIPRNKVVMPPKNLFKKISPFYHSDTLALGRHIIGQISDLAVAQKLPLVVDFGTLLGLTRDKDIIAWDDDIDFSLPTGLELELEQILMDFIQASNQNLQWRFERIADKKGQSSSYLLEFADPDGELIEFKTSFSFRSTQAGKSIHLPSLGMWFAPEKHFKSYELLDFNGHHVQVPADYKEYLTFLYDDWQTPKKNIQLSDYANIQTVSFEAIKNAGFHVESLQT